MVSVSGARRLNDMAAQTDRIRLEVSDKDLARLPATGGFITVSNRPFGAIEELILSHLLTPRRPDHSFLDNAFLREVDEVRDRLLTDGGLHAFRDIADRGDVLSLFPVGNISEFQAPNASYTDSKWDKHLIRSIHQAEVPVVPIYLKGIDSTLCRMLGMMHPAVKTRRLITEWLRSNRLDVRVRIGRPIRPTDIRSFYNAAHFGRFLRAKVYSLGSALKVDSFYRTTPPAEPEAIAPPDAPDVLCAELDVIRSTNLIGSHGDFDVFLTKAKKVPTVIRELGRLREIAFRAVGEGTGQARDLDEYDLHYLHLILWNRTENRISGAYRLGDGDYIMRTMGKKGFYLRSLFKMTNEMNEVLARSIELGRSFVVPADQRKRLPLFLLWKGIADFIGRHPHVRYLIGPVTISGSYSTRSRSLMVQFVRRYYWDDVLSQWIRPRTPFTPDLGDLDHEPLLDKAEGDAKVFDAILEDIEPLRMGAPVLLKKYFKQNARIAAFNLDPQFNDALDGFMVTRVGRLPEEALEGFGG